MMDDKAKTPPSAEQEREKGANFEYDIQDEDALGQDPPAPREQGQETVAS